MVRSTVERIEEAVDDEEAAEENEVSLLEKLEDRGLLCADMEAVVAEEELKEELHGVKEVISFTLSL